MEYVNFIKEKIMLVNNISTIITLGIFIYLIYQIKKNKESLNDELYDLKEEYNIIAKEKLFHEVLRKNYYEFFIAELKKAEIKDVISISVLQDDMENAIIEERYEDCRKIQTKINNLLNEDK